MRGVLVGFGSLLALAAFVGALEVAPYECKPCCGGDFRNRLTTESVSLLAVGGLLVFVTLAYAVLSARRSPFDSQPTSRRNYTHALLGAAVPAILIALLFTFIVRTIGPSCD